MIVYSAAWILPIATPPVIGGWVAVEDGRITSVGGVRERPPIPVSADNQLSSAVILPGVVNAHTHLELSWMRGLVPPARSMPEWASQLIRLRRTTAPEADRAIVRAVAEMRACGTSLVGDTANTLSSFGAIAESSLSAYLFRELLGFNVGDPARLVADAYAELAAVPSVNRMRSSVVPHAPYSVSPELLSAIALASEDRIVSAHVGESPEELEFLRQGTGRWRGLLEELGVWSGQWTAPVCRPVEYLDRFGLVNERLLAVHSVQLADSELERLATVGATVVTCPRSNHWTGAGAAQVGRFYGSGVRVAVGTDSLASVEDLNIFNELAAIRALAPAVPAARLLESVTRSGADALGFGTDLGTIEPGKRAELIAVRIPKGVDDVEEYLVSGIQPVDITWLDSGCR